MKWIVVVASLIAGSLGGFLPQHYGGGVAYSYGHEELLPPPTIVHKVPIATSYQHESRIYHPSIPIIKAVPVVKHVPLVLPVHTHTHAHAYGHGGLYGGHGFGHY